MVFYCGGGGGMGGSADGGLVCTKTEPQRPDIEPQVPDAAPQQLDS